MKDGDSKSSVPAADPDRLAQLRAMYGDFGARFIEDLADVAPDFGEMILDLNIAVMNRPGLPKRDRELIVIGALTALGNAPRQLRAHMTSALDLGASSEEVAEVIM